MKNLENDIRNYYEKNMKYPSDHVIRISKSIFLHKAQILKGGGFVTAFCANDLKQTVGMADDEIGRNIKTLVIFSMNYRPDPVLWGEINEFYNVES